MAPQLMARPNSAAYVGLGSDDTGDSFGRMARGSAGVAELVHVMEELPWENIELFEHYCQRHAGVLFPGQAWSTEDIVKRRVESLEGHRTLKKMMTVLAHSYELCRRHPNDVAYVRSFLGQALKASLEASNNKGNWERSWPLTGLTDPDELGVVSLTSPQEKVALAALQKEKTALQKAAEAAGK